MSRRPLYSIAVALAFVAFTSTSARAQNESHWGVTASFSPTAKAADTFFKETMLNFEGDGDVESSEFTIGLARGSERGGDVSINFIRKRFKDGSSSFSTEEFCDDFGCQSSSESRVMQGVEITGVEFDWSPTFVTIANRVQIGANVGGGVGQLKGTIVETQVFDFTAPGFPPQHDETVELRDAKDVGYSTQALLKLEGQASVIVAPGLKVRIAGGFNAPNYGIRVGAIYLFGSD
jgi:hypothetical protein